MPLDAKDRTKRARKAANVAAKNRKAKTKDRDKNICLAYEYLSGRLFKKSHCYKAYEFLIKTTRSPNLLPQQTILRKLADATGSI